MVLLKAKAIAMYRETTIENPSSLVMMKPIVEVKTTCPTPVIRETFPTSLITRGFKFRPTMNNNRATPIWEKVSRASVELITLRTKGPKKIPLKM